MKKIKSWKVFLLMIVGILIGVLFFDSCDIEQRKGHFVNKDSVLIKIVAKKKEATTTDYHYKYNWWKGGFYQQPDVHQVYYIFYTDGTDKKTDDLRWYTFLSVGDTVRDTIQQSLWVEDKQ